MCACDGAGCPRAARRPLSGRLPPEPLPKAGDDVVSDLTVRSLVTADVPMLLDMLRELAAFTGDLAAMTAQRADLDEALAEVPPRFRGLIAEDGSGVVGYLSYTIDYSIWTGGDF